MPLNERNQRNFTLKLFAGMLETVTLLKREDDQREGVVRTITLYGVRRGKISKTGQPIQNDLLTEHTTTWHIPRRELERVKVNYLNPLDRIVDKYGRYWQVETPQHIDVKLFQLEVDLFCVRIDPPGIHISKG